MRKMFKFLLQCKAFNLKLSPNRKSSCSIFVFRIQRSGGFLSWNSVGQANVNGRLAMTRSIGDFHLKSSGVIAEPETKRVMVSPRAAPYDCFSQTVPLLPESQHLSSLQLQHANDSFLALTSDGINFLLSDQEICDVINRCHDPTEAAEVISEQVDDSLSRNETKRERKYENVGISSRKCVSGAAVRLGGQRHHRHRPAGSLGETPELHQHLQHEQELRIQWEMGLKSSKTHKRTDLFHQTLHKNYYCPDEDVHTHLRPEKPCWLLSV